MHTEKVQHSRSFTYQNRHFQSLHHIKLSVWRTVRECRFLSSFHWKTCTIGAQDKNIPCMGGVFDKLSLIGSQRHSTWRTRLWVNRDPTYSHGDSPKKYSKKHRRELLLFLGFIQISLKSQVKPIRALRLRFFPSLGNYKELPGMTQKPELLSLGFTWISLRSQDNKLELSAFFPFLSFLRDSQR